MELPVWICRFGVYMTASQCGMFYRTLKQTFSNPASNFVKAEHTAEPITALLFLVNSTAKNAPTNYKFFALGAPLRVFGTDSAYEKYFQNADLRFSFYLTMLTL